MDSKKARRLQKKALPIVVNGMKNEILSIIEIKRDIKSLIDIAGFRELRYTWAGWGCLV